MNSLHPGHIRLYLASASPRRGELLAQLGLAYELLIQDIDETRRESEAAETYVNRLALEKARAALLDPAYTLPIPVLAADTTVVCDGAVLGKPDTEKDALAMLGKLSGRQHQVLTAICVINKDQSLQTMVSTNVTFRSISVEEIQSYWQSGEPCDKAGAYAIQGLGSMFISRIEGSYSAVVGLPLFETMQLLANFNITASQVMQEYSK